MCIQGATRPAWPGTRPSRRKPRRRRHERSCAMRVRSRAAQRCNAPSKPSNRGAAFGGSPCDAHLRGSALRGDAPVRPPEKEARRRTGCTQSRNTKRAFSGIPPGAGRQPRKRRARSRVHETIIWDACIRRLLPRTGASAERRDHAPLWCAASNSWIPCGTRENEPPARIQIGEVR